MINYSNINNDNQISYSIPLCTFPYIVTNEFSKEKISQNLPQFSKLTKGKKSQNHCSHCSNVRTVDRTYSQSLK